MTDDLPAAFELRVPTDLAFVRVVRTMLEGLLGSEGWGEDDVEDAGLLVTEIVQNAIEHGSSGDGSEWVSVGCQLQRGAMTLDVVDPGTGVDPQGVLASDPSIPPPLDVVRGRGLFLIHRIASRFDRDLAEHGGLRVVVRKETGSS